MITLNQIIKKFQDIATAHLQINSFGFGDVWEIEASGAKTAPVMWLYWRQSDTSERVITHSFSLLFMDLVDKDEHNENDVLSDQLLICTDVLALLDDPTYWDDMIIDVTSGIEPFTERFENEWSGVSVDFTLRCPFTRNNCLVPTT
jgi:hypothetical protein